MKLETLLSELEAIEDWGVQEYWDRCFDGSCPCFSGQKVVEGKKIGFTGRCWRVSKNDQDLYVWGEWDKKTLRKVAKEVKRALDNQKWYNPYSIIYKEENL